MPIPAAAIAGGLLLLALSKKKTSTATGVCPTGYQLDATGRCVPVAGGAGAGASSGSTGSDVLKTGIGVAGSVLGIGGQVVGTFVKTGVIGGGAATASSNAAVESAIATTAASVITAADVGYAFLGGAFLILVAGIIVGPTIMDIIQSNARAWMRAREVNGGRRYFNAILHEEMKQFETIVEQAIDKLNTAGAPYVAFNAGQVLKPGATSIPYSFTRDLFDQTAYNEVDLPYDGDAYYYVNSFDPRLPVLALADGHILSRYSAWVAAEEQNRCLYAFYGTTPDGTILAGTPQAQITGPGGLTPQGQAIFSMEPGQLRPALESLFAGVPLKYTAGIPIPTAFDDLRAVVAASLGRLSGQAGAPTLAVFDAKMTIVGASRGIAQAANVGFTQLWPGDAAFALGIWQRCGLAARGWPPPRQLDIPGSPGAGGGSNGWSWFIVDPSGSFAIDVKSSGAAASPKVYAMPQAATRGLSAGLGRFGGRRAGRRTFSRFADAVANQADVEAEYEAAQRAALAPALRTAKQASSLATQLMPQGTPGSGSLTSFLLPAAAVAGVALWLTRKKS